MPYGEALLAGVLVGALDAVLRVRSAAPPPVALLGMLLGETLVAVAL
ncbi:DUF1427 family protein [Streptomyces collinus]|nr:DUF1427 family protein [Streptomyces collinus]